MPFPPSTSPPHTTRHTHDTPCTRRATTEAVHWQRYSGGGPLNQLVVQTSSAKSSAAHPQLSKRPHPSPSPPCTHKGSGTLLMLVRASRTPLEKNAGCLRLDFEAWFYPSQLITLYLPPLTSHHPISSIDTAARRTNQDFRAMRLHRSLLSFFLLLALLPCTPCS